jgi:hypothetical protein
MIQRVLGRSPQPDTPTLILQTQRHQPAGFFRAVGAKQSPTFSRKKSLPALAGGRQLTGNGLAIVNQKSRLYVTARGAGLSAPR